MTMTMRMMMTMTVMVIAVMFDVQYLVIVHIAVYWATTE